MAEQARPMGGGTESLSRQDRLLCVLVEKFQPVWREIEKADVFRRRGLGSRDELLVPQNVMIGLVMLRGLLAEAGQGVLPWLELAARRDTDPALAATVQTLDERIDRLLQWEAGAQRRRSGASRARSDDHLP